ncbi:hypothetical protein [Isoptericola sp. NPDC019482]|uniref:hypothetical protein n=1 Tax=Isoptericola sp. NPDC019482 TaxID=3154688 RepID=UPI00348DCE65
MSTEASVPEGIAERLAGQIESALQTLEQDPESHNELLRAFMDVATHTTEAILRLEMLVHVLEDQRRSLP